MMARVDFITYFNIIYSIQEIFKTFWITKSQKNQKYNDITKQKLSECWNIIISYNFGLDDC